MKYRGMIDCFLKISRQEGVRALYSGIGPAVLRQSTYGTIKFGTYYTLKHIANSNGWLIDEYGNENVLGNMGCAIVAGAISSAIANPTDVLKVRMQVHGRGSHEMGLVKCFHEIYVHEGVKGLWRVSSTIKLNYKLITFFRSITGSHSNCTKSGHYRRCRTPCL